MELDDFDSLRQLDAFLSWPNQSWLLGAGICKDAGIPLMCPLTSRVRDLMSKPASKRLLTGLFAELPDKSHIEDLLSHLGDYIALATRKREGVTVVNGKSYSLSALKEAHTEIVGHIARTIRWGFREAAGEEPAIAGSHEKPIVKIEAHRDFLEALIGKRQDGLYGRRHPVRLFTTNYDTLIEDALALSGYSAWDGFSSGALAFRTHRYGETTPEAGFRAHLVKLHGSIDWSLDERGKVVRVREHDAYPKREGRVLIYPQSTKYLATQRDPFAAQFDIFRHALAQRTEGVLGICGYSFGDDHINQEIELAFSAPDNKTTLLAFCEEFDELPAVLEKWRDGLWGNRVYIMTQKSLYVGKDRRLRTRDDGKAFDWWTFAGVTKLLSNGVEDARNAEL